MADELTQGPLSQVDSTETPREQVAYGAALKPGAEVKYKIPVQFKTGAVPESLLADMEQIYQKKVAAQSPFQEWMKDIMAWGGTERPGTTGETLAKRAKEKEQQDIDLFTMRAQMAAAKAQMEQQARQAATLKSLSGGVPVPAAGVPVPAAGVPVPAAGVPVPAAGVPVPAAGVPVPAAGVPASELPPHVAAEVREKLSMDDIAGAQKVVDEYRKGFTSALTTAETKYRYDPALDQPVEVPVNGTPVTMTVRQWSEYAKNNPTIRAILQSQGVNVPAGAVPAGAVPAGAVPAGAVPAGAVPRAVMPAPAAPAIGGGLSMSDIKRAKDVAAKPEEAYGTKSGEALAAEKTTLKDEALAARRNIEIGNRMNEIASKYENMFGTFMKPGIPSALGMAITEGFKIGAHGQLAFPSLEQIVRQNTKGYAPEEQKKAISAAREMEGYLREIELAYSKAFRGQGSVTENERKIVQAMAGTISDPAELLRKKAIWLKLSAQKDKAIGDAWDSYAGRFGDSASSLATFQRTIKKQILDKYDADLKANFQKEWEYGQNMKLSPGGSEELPKAPLNERVKRALGEK